MADDLTQAQLQKPGKRVSIEALPQCARFSLRLAPEQALVLVHAAGFRLDLPINRSAEDGARRSARLGPDEWLLLGKGLLAENLAREIVQALAGRFFSLVDVSHRDLAVQVVGDDARAVINSGCPLDLRETAFPPGSATRTVLAQTEIVLIRSDLASYRLESRRSFGPYLVDFLTAAARQFAVA